MTGPTADGPLPSRHAAALRELARTVGYALTLPEPGPSALDEELLLRLSRDRADLVCQAMTRITSSHGTDTGPRDVTTTAAWLRDQTAALPADIYQHETSQP